jgi:hypothetical protein
MSEEREQILDYAAPLTDAQLERLAYLLARDRERPSPAEGLEELERDTHAGRTVKWDVRCAPDEKVAWSEAAHALGVSQS